jgi:intracellular sulfur oxidation DsrE/DsrF family protein
MAAMMAESRAVLVYFDITGIDAVLTATEDFGYAHRPRRKGQQSALVGKGVTRVGCPGCLKAAGKSAADLADGIQLADKKKFFTFTDGRILSLDY